MPKPKTRTAPQPAPLADIEWTTLWMAMRYAMGRETIAAGTLPAQIAEAYYERLNESQRRQLVQEIDRHEEEYVRHHGDSLRAFGDPYIDAPQWRRLRAALDTGTHRALSVPGTEKSITVFECDGDFYPLHLYLRCPSIPSMVNKGLVNTALHIA